MKLKPNQTLSDKTYSNLTSFFGKKILKYFSDFQNQNFISFMTTVNLNNANETESDIFQ